MKYKQLTREQRYQIFALLEMGHSQIEIAKVIGKHKSTISRELRRNSGKNRYEPARAHKKAMARNITRKRIKSEILWSFVEGRIRVEWSPEQIAGWLEKNHLERVSHEAIYQRIYKDKKAGGVLHRFLRLGKIRRKRAGKYDRRGAIPNRISIDERPKIVDERSRIGDWEADTIIGKKRQQAIVTLVDRRSRFTILAKVDRRTAVEVGNAMINMLKPMREKVETITSDNGKEFAGHEKVAKELDADFYFAHPYSSWERGTNENTNGLVRQYLPKRTDFDEVPDFLLDEISERLNHRPRKCLGFRTPFEVFYNHEVALQC